jgi:copper(I)-binding protein
LLTGCKTEPNDVTALMPHAYVTAPGQKNGAVFMTLNNNVPIKKVITEAKGDIAPIIELHQSLVDPYDGMMRMRKIRQIEIPPNKTVVLGPYGLHIMLIGLIDTLEEGDTFPLTLYYRDGEEQEILVEVVRPSPA